MVSLSVGNSTLFPDAQARVSDGTVAYADGAAVTACPGNIQFVAIESLIPQVIQTAGGQWLIGRMIGAGTADATQ